MYINITTSPIKPQWNLKSLIPRRIHSIQARVHKQGEEGKNDVTKGVSETISNLATVKFIIFFLRLEFIFETEPNKFFLGNQNSM